MTLDRRLPPLPEGYSLERGQRGVLACRPEDRSALLGAGFLADNLHVSATSAELEDADVAGREPLGRLRVGEVECLARRFRHGGLARGVTGRRFLDPARPFVELALAERLRSLGVRTPRVVAARAVPVAPVGYELTLVTERIQGTVDVGHLIGGVRGGEVDRAFLRRALAASGRLVRAVHDAGLYHADLQPANVLVPSGPGAASSAPDEAWILDLDRSRFPAQGPLEPALRAKNLGRLWRHVRRREAEYGRVLSRADRVRFLAAYGVPRDEIVAVGASIEEAARAKGAWHRLGWWIDRTVGRAHDPRAAGQETGSTSSSRG